MPGESRDLSLVMRVRCGLGLGEHLTATGIGKAKMKEPRRRFDKAEALCLHRSSLRRAVRQRHKQSTDQTAGGVDLDQV